MQKMKINQAWLVTLIIGLVYAATIGIAVFCPIGMGETAYADDCSDLGNWVTGLGVSTDGNTVTLVVPATENYTYMIRGGLSISSERYPHLGIKFCDRSAKGALTLQVMCTDNKWYMVTYYDEKLGEKSWNIQDVTNGKTIIAIGVFSERSSEWIKIDWIKVYNPVSIEKLKHWLIKRPYEAIFTPITASFIVAGAMSAYKRKPVYQEKLTNAFIQLFIASLIICVAALPYDLTTAMLIIDYAFWAFVAGVLNTVIFYSLKKIIESYRHS